MSAPIVLQNSFDRGMVRDIPRTELPENALYTSTNMLPDLGAPLRRRGSWSYFSGDINAASATTRVAGGIYAEFEAGAKTVVVNEVGRVLDIDTSGNVTDVAAGVTTRQNPIMHRNTVIIPCDDGTTGPKSYSGAAVANLGGSPPTAIYAAVHKDWTLLANSDAEPQRVWISAAGNPASWTTASRYIDTSYPVSGIWSLRSSILVFSSSRVERIRGNTPPPGGDMIVESLFDVGCMDARTIAPWGEHVVFANGEGIYITNGSALDDVTASCGMKSYWRSQLDNVMLVTASTFRNYYIVTVIYDEGGSAGTERFTAFIDLQRRTWWGMSGFRTSAWWKGQASGGAVGDETYFALYAQPRVAAISSVFVAPDATPAGYKDDNTNAGISWSIDTPEYLAPRSTKRWKRAYITYELRNDSGGGTDGAGTATGTVEGGGAGASIAMPETTAKTRARDDIGAAGHSLRFTAFHTGTTNTRITDTKIYSFEADVYDREGSRLG